MPMIRLMIVDDYALFREGLATIIRSEPDIEIVGLAGSVREAAEMARQTRPDMILMDFSLPDGTGDDATRQILAEVPECKIVFLTMSEEGDNLFDAIHSGAKGYLLKNMQPSKLVFALRSVQNGESALSRDHDDAPDMWGDARFKYELGAISEPNWIVTVDTTADSQTLRSKADRSDRRFVIETKCRIIDMLASWMRRLES